jgi:hypothetical protein
LRNRRPQRKLAEQLPNAATPAATTARPHRLHRLHPPPALITAIKDPIYYLREYNVLVCKQHVTAIQNLDAHLRDQHAIAHKLRDEIVGSYQHRWVQRREDIKTPAPLGPPIDELGAPLDGLQCAEEDCGFITINQDGLRKHRKSVHNLAWSAKDSTAYTEVTVQTFFQKSALRRYFLVDARDDNNDDDDDDDDPSIPREVVDVVKERLAEWQLTQRAHEERAQVMDAHVAKTDKTGWFKRTGWLEHFANRNLMHLAHQTRLPDQSEVKLRRAAKLTKLLVERSVKGLSTLARETRRWLRSAKRQEVDQRPMARLQNPES